MPPKSGQRGISGASAHAGGRTDGVPPRTSAEQCETGFLATSLGEDATRTMAHVPLDIQGFAASLVRSWRLGLDSMQGAGGSCWGKGAGGCKHARGDGKTLRSRTGRRRDRRGARRWKRAVGESVGCPPPPTIPPTLHNAPNQTLQRTRLEADGIPPASAADDAEDKGRRLVTTVSGVGGAEHTP